MVYVPHPTGANVVWTDALTVMLNLEQLKELKQFGDWSKLILPDGHKEIVQAMVETYARGSREPGWGGSTNHQGRVSLDLVQGKGVFLDSKERTVR